MENINDIKKKIAEMAKIAFKMLELTYQAFMEHNPDLSILILKEEEKLNNLEKEIMQELVNLSSSNKNIIKIYADVAGDIEIIGDYCKDIIERVQIKIAEKLLFSDDAVQDYGDLYKKVKDTLESIVYALEKDKPALMQEVIKDKKQIDNLMEEYRNRHDQRLIEGVCKPLACNMFLNMLDFTAQISNHTNAIANSVLKLK